MLALLMPHIHKVNLLTLPLQQGLALSAIPVIFTSFGFHGSVPSIVSYMNGNIRKLRWVFITGSAIPLVAYIFWQLATLGSINSSTFMGLLANHAGLNGLLQALREVVASPHVELAVHLFADLALATSFLGVALGLFDYGRPLPAPQYRSRKNANRRGNLPAAAGIRAVLSAWFRHGHGVCGRCHGGAGAAHSLDAGMAEQKTKSTG